MKKILIIAAILSLITLAAAYTDDLYNAVTETVSEEAVEYPAQAAEGLAAIHPEYDEEEETAPLPESGNVPHINVTRIGNDISAADDGTLSMYEKEDYWKAMDPNMPDYCKPYLEDTAFTGARNVLENELSVNYYHGFACRIGYRHGYTAESLADVRSADPLIEQQIKDCSLLRYKKSEQKIGDKTIEYYLNILSDGINEIYLPVICRDIRLLDIQSCADSCILLYIADGKLFVQYVYPEALNGKTVSYLYDVNTIGNADSVKGNLLTNNIYRLEYSDKRTEHWQIKQSEADLENYTPDIFPAETAFADAWKYLRTRRTLLWTNDSEDPAIYSYELIKREDTDRRAWNFNGDTSKEPVYTE